MLSLLKPSSITSAGRLSAGLAAGDGAAPARRQADITHAARADITHAARAAITIKQINTIPIPSRIV